MTCNKDRIDNNECAIKSEGTDNHDDVIIFKQKMRNYYPDYSIMIRT